MSAKEIILKLNEIGGANGIGLLDIIENRLAIAKKEAPNALLYDYIIVNRDGAVKEAAAEILACVTAESLKPMANRDVIATYFE